MEEILYKIMFKFVPRTNQYLATKITFLALGNKSQLNPFLQPTSTEQ